jgi:hypothetical protein
LNTAAREGRSDTRPEPGRAVRWEEPEGPTYKVPGARLHKGPVDYPIAPTEFPKGRSTAQNSGAKAPS